jgi:hypothetical protein
MMGKIIEADAKGANTVHLPFLTKLRASCASAAKTQ